MARKKYSMTEARIRRFIREGRGKGSGSNYKPWHRVSDVPSLGRVHRPFGNKAGRQHHLLSDNEYFSFLIAEWDDNVIDIREQFPLLERHETVEIALSCGVKHPVDPHSQALWVLTTDQLLTVNTNNGIQLVARTIKQADDLGDERTLEKLEIERRYWMRRGVAWEIVTNLQLKNQYTKNLALIFDNQALDPERQQSMINEVVYRELVKVKHLHPYTPVKIICSSIDRQYGYLNGESLAALRRLLWSKRIWIDLNVRNIQDLPIHQFEILKGNENENK